MQIKTATLVINFGEARNVNELAPSLGVKMAFEVEWRALKNGKPFGRRFWKSFDTETQRDDFITDLVTG
jgi:hypothetical protein